MRDSGPLRMRDDHHRCGTVGCPQPSQVRLHLTEDGSAADRPPNENVTVADRSGQGALSAQDQRSQAGNRYQTDDQQHDNRREQERNQQQREQ